jgi:hypothetical protein
MNRLVLNVCSLPAVGLNYSHNPLYNSIVLIGNVRCEAGLARRNMVA